MRTPNPLLDLVARNPRAIHQRQLRTPLGVQCDVTCVTCKNIIGPYFFENKDVSAVTVSGDRYWFMIEHFIHPTLENIPDMRF